MQRLEQHASFGGHQEVWQHESDSTGTPMKFGIYLPPAALAGEKCPVLYWLSGLTCTEQNFITKAGSILIRLFFSRTLFCEENSVFLLTIL